MKPRLLLGLMLCTLFSMSAPAFAQPSTVQPVLNTAQAATDVTIPQGTTQVFDASKGEIKFDGVLTNKGTIIIRSFDPAQAEAILRAGKVINEGKIVSEVPTLTIKAESVTGKGEATATESIAIQNDKDLQIIGGKYRANFFRPSTDGKLNIQAQRIDAKVDLKAFEVSIGVNEGNLDIIGQKLDGDPIYYNRGGDITAVMPSNGEDIYVLAAGNVTLSNVDTSGGANGEVGRLVVSAGVHFAITVNDGNSQFPCGTFGASCPNVIEQNSGPGQIFEPAPGGPFPPSGTIILDGAKARVISLFARDIVVNGTLQAIDDPTTLAAPAILLTAANSITVNAQLKTDQSVIEPNYGIVALEAPTINVNGKITSDHVFIAAFENSVASTGSITTAAIEARTYIEINGGHIQFAEAGGAFAGSAVLPLSQPHDSGEFTIKTGKLTAHRYVVLAATGNIDAGNIELLPNEANVPLGTHDVRIHANVGKEDAPPLKIGGGTNGAASITVRGTTDLGAGLTQKTGAIFLTNGPSGDIVLDGAKITVTNEHDGTPSLIAYAGTGQVTVKGSIVLDGTSSAPAGQVLLVGDEIRSTGATISAKDTLSTPAENPAKVVLVASKLTLAGDLTIEANSKAQTSVRVVPKGSVTLDPQDNFPGIYVNVDKFPVNVTEDEVLVAGAGNLTLKAKSDQAKVEITAKPLKFNNGTAQIFATGEGSQINIDYPGAASGVNSLVFSGGAVTFNTDNDQATAGDINITADGVKGNDGSPLNLHARGNATFDGGHVTVNAAKILLEDAASSIDVSAKGSSGNGGNVSITATTVINMKGSTKTNGVCTVGDGGTINLTGTTVLFDSIEANSGNVDSCVAVAAVGPKPLTAGNGDGGTVIITANKVDGTENAVFNSISANGQGNGKGGEIQINNTNAIDLTDLSLRGITAEGAGTGTAEGGKITITKVSAVPSRGLDETIVVGGGSGVAETDFNGSISLNDVICYNKKLPAGAHADHYWNCNNQSLFGPILNGLSQPTKDAIAANPEVWFYNFGNFADAQKYLKQFVQGGNTDLGFSYPPPGQNANRRLIVVYDRIQSGPVNTTQFPNRREGALRHEVGHQVDTSFGKYSQSAYYKELVEQDWTRFNNLSKCTLFPAACTNGVPNPPYDTMTNRQILSTLPLGVPAYFGPDIQWRELFAEEFAIAAGGGTDENNVITPWIRGYFQCSQAYANSVYTSGAGGTPVFPQGCTPPQSPKP